MEIEGVVRVPVANLRKEPIDAPAGRFHDELQESQLLFNETLLVKDERNGWYYVDAKEQRKFTAEKGWHGYPGWVRTQQVRAAAGPLSFNGVVKRAFTFVRTRPAADGTPLVPLSLGVRLVVSDEASAFYRVCLDDRAEGWVAKGDVRLTTAAPTGGAPGHEAAAAARLFLGVPYLWGGRSMPLPVDSPVMGGVDCSGLINLAFRAAGVDIPRDAHDQWLAAADSEGCELEEGDLIFMPHDARSAPIGHVMLSLSGEEFIEASETGDVVRVSTFADRFGFKVADLRQKGFLIGEKRLFFRRIPDGS